jgi:hypothetical protein
MNVPAVSGDLSSARRICTITTCLRQARPYRMAVLHRARVDPQCAPRCRRELMILVPVVFFAGYVSMVAGALLSHLNPSW